MVRILWKWYCILLSILYQDALAVDLSNYSWWSFWLLGSSRCLPDFFTIRYCLSTCTSSILGGDSSRHCKYPISPHSLPLLFSFYRCFLIETSSVIGFTKREPWTDLSFRKIMLRRWVGERLEKWKQLQKYYNSSFKRWWHPELRQ